MRPLAIALSPLLLSVGLLSSAAAQAAPTPGYSSAPIPPATGTLPGGAVQLAAGAKGGDKFMSGRAGGRYGIGGAECKTCRKKKK